MPMPPDRRVVSPVGFALVGMEMVGFTVVGVLIDWLAGSAPWATAILTILGMLAAMTHLIQLVKKGTANTRNKP
jgi:F0F1-type ATP synthase assembly protein I